MAPARVTVEVVYAAPVPVLRTVVVEAGSSVFEVIRQSQILSDYPQIDLHAQRVGIFGRLVALSEQAKAGDRIEIYVALPHDPKESRRRRARN